MLKILIIGCTDVTRFIVPVLCSSREYVSELCIAAKEKEDCDVIKKSLPNSPVRIVTAGVDVTNEEKTLLMVKIFGPQLIINLGPSKLNKVVMELALKIGASYIDSKYCADISGKASFRDQLAYSERFKQKGLTAFIGCGFNPGVTTVFVKQARKKFIESVTSVDVIDINSGTNDNPNLMNTPVLADIAQLSTNPKSISDGQVVETESLSVKTVRSFPGIGRRTIYLLNNQVVDTFGQIFPEINNVRFFSSFKKQFLSLVNVLRSVGMLSKEPIEIQGVKIAPVDFLSSILPHEDRISSSKGVTGIGVIVTGKHASEDMTVMYYVNVDYSDIYDKYKIGATDYLIGQAILAGTQLICSGKWDKPGVSFAGEIHGTEWLDKMTENGLEFKIVENAEPIVTVDTSDNEDDDNE